MPRRVPTCCIVNPSLTITRISCSRGRERCRHLGAFAGLPGEAAQGHDGRLLEVGVDQALAVGDPPDAVADRAQPVGLAEVAAHAEPQRVEHGGAVGAVGQHEHARGDAFFTDRAERLEAVAVVEFDVQDDHVGMVTTAGLEQRHRRR